ncbi:MAG TPA: hypothetical protein VKM55_01470 [Candidatus Lokiarchaeia archaeon]|nr:hypothetical protein [Candidatus Lokiarchaeia archaeon]
MNDEGRNDLRAGFAKPKDRSFDPSFIAGYRVDFSPIEKKILLIAKQLMKKHYLLDTEELRLQATRELKDDAPDAIYTAILSLIAKKILFDGAAMTKDDVLVNETRHHVFDTICHQPGIHFSAIRAHVDTDSRTLLFHLNVLQRFGLVRFERINNNKAYFETSLPREHDILHYYLQNENARRIFKAILENQAVSLDELDTILKESMTLQALTWRIKILMEHKLISGKFDGKKLISLIIPSKYRGLIKNQFLNS